RAPRSGRHRDSAGAASALRHRPDPDGEPARPFARHARIPQVRTGRFSGLPVAAAAAGAGIRLPPARGLDLHTAAGRVRAVRPAAALRHRSGHERPKGQSGTFPAGRSHQDSGGSLPGRILRAQLGKAPGSAPEGSAPSGRTSGRAAPGAPDAGGLRGRGRHPAVLRAEGSGAGAGPVFPVSHAVLVADGRPGPAVFGAGILVAAVFVGYHFGQPRTVVDRIDMWLSPWDNDVRGGNQLAHALWAFSTGGVWGSGPGYGYPGMIPAGSTDLVLPAIGEE